jgi:hypothetical protein
MEMLMNLHKSVNLPEKMFITDGSGGYDMRKAISSDILGHETSVAEHGSMPFFKEAYVKARIENAGGNVEGMTFEKALTTTLSTYSAGTLPVLIPVYVDPEIIDLTRRATPLVELIPRVTNYGKTAEYNQITAIATAQFLPEDPAENEQNDTFARKKLDIKYLYSIGRVTGPMFAASKQYLSSGGYVDALSLEVKNKTLALKRLEEAAILLGDATTNWTEPVNSTTITATYSFDGLYNLITGNNASGLAAGGGYGGSAGNYTDLGGVSLSISSLRTAIRTPRTRGGEPNLIVTDYATYDVIKSLIQDQLRYVSTQTIAWGITTVSFEGIPIIASRFLSTTAGTGAMVPQTGRSLFVLDTNVIEMRVLQDVSYEELAKTNDSVKFHLKCYEALVVKAPQFNWVVYDIGA